MNAQLAAAESIVSLLSVGCMTAGYLAVRRRRLRAHGVAMALAFLLQCGFAVLFITRLRTFGLASFDGSEHARVAYMVLLAAHEAVAVAVVPLVLVTLALAVLRRWAEHRAVAHIALAAWIWVSISGALVWAARAATASN